MFSLSKINEKLKKKEKPKKRSSKSKLNETDGQVQENEKLKKRSSKSKFNEAVGQQIEPPAKSEDLLLFQKRSSVECTLNLESPALKKQKRSRKEGFGHNWRFFNNIDKSAEVNDTIVVENTSNVLFNASGGVIEESASTYVAPKSKSGILKLTENIPDSKKTTANVLRKLKKKRSKKNMSASNVIKKTDTTTNFDSEMAEFLKIINEISAEKDETAVPNISSSKVDDSGFDTTAHPLYDTKELPYLSTKIVPGCSLLVALFPDSRLHLVGYYKIQLLLGSVSIMGYKFHEMEERIVSCPTNYSILPINILEGFQVKQLSKEKLEALNIPSDWVLEFNIPKDQMIAIVKITKYESNVTRFLTESKMIKPFHKKNWNLDLWTDVVGVHHVENFNPDDGWLFKEGNEWNDFVMKLVPRIQRQQKLIILVAGGKNVGKTTFLKFLLNNFLNFVDQVACLDLDPGQSEFSLPGVLSFSVLKSPILGPSFMHSETVAYEYQRTVLLGNLSANHFLKEYLDIAQSLLLEFEKMKSFAPLIINTMGFTQGLGYDIIVELLRLVQPSNVAYITSSDNSMNFNLSLHCDFISNINRGIVRRRPFPLSYELTTLNKVYVNGHSLGYNSKFLRSIRIMAYLAQLWRPNESNFKKEALKPCVQIDWTSVGIHARGDTVSHRHILRAIDGCLVAFCQVDDKYLEAVGLDAPLRIQEGGDWLKTNSCLGWGIVRGIDPTISTIYALTPICQDFLVGEINAIVVCETKLPDQFHQLLASEGAPYIGPKPTK